jgi:GTPase SAR1 family protein
MAQEGTEQTENLWNSILKESSRSINDRLDAKTVLVLGDRNGGKSTLVTRLQGMDITQVEKGVALGYSFLDIRNTNEADDEPVARLNVWQMEGEPELKELLKFGLNPNSISNCVVIIALDFHNLGI